MIPSTIAFDLEPLCSESEAPLLAARRSPPEHFALGAPMDAATLSTLEQHAFRYGRGYDSYLAVERNREYFWCSDRLGVVGFIRARKYVFVLGGLLAAPANWRRLLDEFMEFAEARSYKVAFCNVDDAQAELFRAADFQVTKVGEDTVIDLPTRTWSGKDFEWVRRQSSYCLRQGVVCEQVDMLALPIIEREPLQRELVAVSKEFLRQKLHGRNMRYFVGRFDPADLGRRKLFVARAEGGKGRVEAFVVCNPSHNGQRWAVEMFRQREDAVRGAVPFLIHQTMLTLKNEGVGSASLCMVPALRCQTPAPRDSRLLRWFMRLSYWLTAVYDLPGLYHFKSRFRPRFENCYFCAYPRTSCLMLHASLNLWGADRIPISTLTRKFVQKLFKRRGRATLALPDAK